MNTPRLLLALNHFHAPNIGEASKVANMSELSLMPESNERKTMKISAAKILHLHLGCYFSGERTSTSPAHRCLLCFSRLRTLADTYFAKVAIAWTVAAESWR